MDSNSEDGGYFIHDCPSQQDATQYRVMYSHDRNTEQTSSKSLGEHPRTSQARGVLQEEDPPPDGGSQEADGERQVF